MKSISIVILTYNAEETIAKCVDSVLMQDYKGNKEIIIVDNNSKDRTLDILKNYGSRIKLFNNKMMGISRATNLGIKKAKNKIICLLLGDYVLPEKRWLEKSLDFMEKEKVEILTFPLYIPKEAFRNYDFINKISSFSPRVIKKSNINVKTERFVLFKKKVFDKVLFDENYYHEGEDTDFALSAKEKGFKIKIAPEELAMKHYHGNRKSNFLEYIKKHIQISEAKGINFRKHKYISNIYSNEITNTFIYLFLFIPYLRWLSVFYIFGISFFYAGLFFIWAKDYRAIFLVPLKIIKDLIAIIYFWEGFLTKKAVEIIK